MNPLFRDPVVVGFALAVGIWWAVTTLVPGLGYLLGLIFPMDKDSRE